ncbi:Cytochrome [Abeliophyllum distichum]|uniref:Flavonoid-6-hydroxylase n=1 Tax=Abeliophyllum distichum TaxID=126358 RepID=A0ABD1Q3I0_9LAMI
MADKHGPIFSLRLGSHPTLVVSGWEMIKDCFSTNDRIFITRPSMAVTKYMGYSGAVFALAPYGSYWRSVRKMVTLELLTSYRLEKLSHLRVSEVDYSIKDLYLRCAKNGDFSKIALSKWCEDLTFNITIRMLAGKRFSDSSDNKNGGEEWHFKEAIKKALYLSGVFVVSDAIPSLEWMDIGGYLKAMKTTAKDINKVLENWLKEHVQKRKECNNEGESDFMDVMLCTLSETDMVLSYNRDTSHQGNDIKSTSETIIWALSLLLNNRRTLEIACEELDMHVGRHKLVQETDINNLNYLQAIVKETLRLYPPGPLSGPREAMEDCYVGNYYVAKGTRLIVNLWKLHRDPKVWSNPDEFRPERFIEEHKNVNFKGQNFEYIPFSSGRRMCPGLTFGLQVIHLILARLLQGFYVSTPMNIPVNMDEGLGIALPKVEPLDVIVTPRLPRELYENL